MFFSGELSQHSRYEGMNEPHGKFMRRGKKREKEGKIELGAFHDKIRRKSSET